MEPEQRRQGDIDATITATTIDGQVVVGDYNTVSRVAMGSSPDAVTTEEMAQLLEQFAGLRALVAVEAPADRKDAALQRLDELEEAVTADKPELSTMEYVKKWFVRNLPGLAGAVTTVVVNPIVGKLVSVAGDGLASEFRRRFGLQSS